MTCPYDGCLLFVAFKNYPNDHYKKIIIHVSGPISQNKQAKGIRTQPEKRLLWLLRATRELESQLRSQITLRDRGSLLFLRGQRRQEPPRRKIKEPLSRRVISCRKTISSYGEMNHFFVGYCDYCSILSTVTIL